MLFYERRPLIKPFSLYNTLSFFVVDGTVEPLQVSPVELVDYLLGKTIYDQFSLAYTGFAFGY